MGNIIRAINETLWGTPMLILLVGCGFYLSIKLKFFQFLGAREWMRESIGSMLRKRENMRGGISPYRALSAALAATVGSGNILGVATAIASGGAGAVLWMWISAFFGMATKYAEIYLAVRFRRKSGEGFFGGPMYYIEDGLGKGWRWLALLFAACGAVACIGMGGMNQSNAIANILEIRCQIPKPVSGVIIAGVAGIVISGGIKKISGVTEALVPIMVIIYIGAGAVVALKNPQAVFDVFGEIARSAFSGSAISGGAAGVAVKSAIRFGVARGVFSNEAGLGSSPIIHAAADAKSPHKQGLWGVFEVFVDTFVICSVTAVIILTGADGATGLSGSELVNYAFSKHMGSFGEFFSSIMMAFFALTTIFGWSYYGETCLHYIVRGRRGTEKAYRMLFVVFVFLGSLLNIELVWELSDLFNGMMMLPNLIALILLSGIVINKK